jgi:hypothetical protein
MLGVVPGTSLADRPGPNVAKLANKRLGLADAGSAIRSSIGEDHHYRIKHLPLEQARTEAL